MAEDDGENNSTTEVKKEDDSRNLSPGSLAKSLSQYALFSKELLEERDESADLTASPDGAHRVLDRADLLYQRNAATIDAPALHEMDRIAFKQASNVAIHRIHQAQMARGSVLTGSSFVRRVQQFRHASSQASLTNADLRRRIGGRLLRHSVIGFGVGTIADIGEASRRQAAPRQTIEREIGEAEAATELNTAQVGEMDPLNHEVQLIYAVIKQLAEENDGEPIGLHRLTHNQQSFSQSVENIFFLSFLVKEGRIALFEKQNGALAVAPVELADGRNGVAAAENHGHTLSRKQFALNYNVKKWRQLCKVFRDDPQPFIRSRRPRDSFDLRARPV